MNDTIQQDSTLLSQPVKRAGDSNGCPSARRATFLVNLDWLEVFGLESYPLLPSVFEGIGMKTIVRDYGTPQYRQMFTLCDTAGFPAIEIRRDPYSVKSKGGIFKDGALHIRLTNRACYMSSPAELMQDFINSFEIREAALSRVDIAADFTAFASCSVEELLRRYMRREVVKLTLPHLSVHGTDASAFAFNSFKWGSALSPFSLKIYNKTLELAGLKKPWISAQWLANGIGADGLDVWRMEFSLKSRVKGFVVLDKGDFLKAELGLFASREGLNELFLMLVPKYADFREQTYTRTGKPRRKSRCPLVKLFGEEGAACAWSSLPMSKPMSRFDRSVAKRLMAIVESGVDPRDEAALVASAEFISRTDRHLREELQHIVDTAQ